MNTVIEAYDSQEVKELKRKIISLEAQLEMQKRRCANLTGGNLLQSQPIDYYPGEQLDFVLSILQQVQANCDPDSRRYDIIQSLLSCNKCVGRGQEILGELNRIFKKGEPNKESDVADLRAIGFTYTQSRKHPKLRFQDKYMFVLPSTTGDSRRSAKNALAEISKCMAMSLKI